MAPFWSTKELSVKSAPSHITKSPAGPLVSSPDTAKAGAKRRFRFKVLLLTHVSPTSSYSMVPWKAKVWTDCPPCNTR